MDNTEKTGIIRVAFYIRVSTDEQAKKGYGLDYQMDSLKQLLGFKQKTDNWALDESRHIYIDDGYTGSDTNRPAFKRMMEDMKKKEFDIIVVWKIDRLSRTLSHLLSIMDTIKESKVGLYSHKENVDFSGFIGNFLFQMFGALAELERGLLKARTAEGKLAAARLGYYPFGGTVPYGYTYKKGDENEKGRKLIIQPQEAKVIQDIFNYFVVKQMSYEAIARCLNDLHIPKGKGNKTTKKITPWYADSIKNILLNEIYTGQKTYRMQDSDENKTDVPVTVPKIIEEIIYLLAQKRIKNISETKGKRGGGRHEYLLSRLITDTATGRKYVGYINQDGNVSYRRKKYTNQETGITYKNKELPGKTIEDSVWDLIVMAINRPKEFYRLYEKQTVHRKELDAITVEIQKLQEAIEREESKQMKIEDDFYAGGIPPERRDAHIMASTKHIVEMKKKLDTQKARQDTLLEGYMAQHAIEQFSKDFTLQIKDLPFEQKKAIVETLVDKILVIEEEKQERVVITFRFAQPRKRKEDEMFEPEKGKRKRTSAVKSPSSKVNGGA